MSDWQPIETAPRDGGPLLCTDGENTHVCYPKLFRSDHWEYFRDDKVVPGHTWSICPTHWLPLPSPPAQETSHD